MTLVTSGERHGSFDISRTTIATQIIYTNAGLDAVASEIARLMAMGII